MTIQVSPSDSADAVDIGEVRLKWSWLLIGMTGLVATVALGVSVGPTSISPVGVLVELFDRLTWFSVDSGLSSSEAAIVWELRFPRVVLGMLVGSVLALCGGAYQGVFRNPLADPYLLGVAAGAGLGATFMIVNEIGDGRGFFDPVPLAAFGGAMLAVAASYTIGVLGDRTRSPTSLILAGVAVASFFTALQTFAQQSNDETIRRVYSWILGSLTTSGWGEVLLLLPYALVCGAVLLAHRRRFDVLAVGDEEAESLGVNVQKTRTIVVLVASLATAAAVAVSGLIAFVGIIVPHTVRLLVGTSYRLVLPLSAIGGAIFLVLTDLFARTALSPAELPIGVVTAFFGAPFFIVVLRSSRQSG
jgi:iron complex transport system permease protein